MGISCYENQSLGSPSKSSGLSRTKMGKKPGPLEWAHPTLGYLSVVFICQSWATLFQNTCAGFF